MLKALPLIAVAILAGAAAPSAGLLESKGPIDFNGDGGNFNPKTCRYTLNGNAWVTQGTAKVQGRSLMLSGRQVNGDCEYNHVEATDDVYYVTPERTIHADRAVYDQGAASAVFTSNGQGGVVVVTGRNVATASKVTVNTATGDIDIEGRVRAVVFPEPSYQAAGSGWSLTTSAAAVSLDRTTGGPVTVGNPGRVEAGDVLSWTTPQLKLTLTKGACTYGGKAYDYAAQVQAGSSSYSGCGGPKSGGS